MYDHRGYYGLNPYAIGFAIFQDIKRMSENPTEEDREWFPDVAGGDWLTNVTYAMKNFRDESFISQYLSPKVIRDFRLFSIEDLSSTIDHYTVKSIHNEDGYKEIRKIFSNSKNISNIDPDIQIYDADLIGDRELVIKYYMHDNIPLDPSATKVLKHIQ